MQRISSAFCLSIAIFAIGCNPVTKSQQTETTTIPETEKLAPVVVTEKVNYDTDDPAIWINSSNPAQSLIIGTDKETDGGIFIFDLNGKIVNKITGLKRPNNVDLAYGILLNGKPKDIFVATERETNKLRIYTLPDLQPVDNGGIEVFTAEKDRSPMGIALYTSPSDKSIYAVVGRKTGPSESYLWQYKLEDDGKGNIKGTVVRKFGNYSGKKEIESIAVDNESGYVYYSDEQYGVHKYYAEPDSGNKEIALFGRDDFMEDIEGISIYKHADGTGYILVSNQQANTFVIYPREGTKGNPHDHKKITEIPVATDESDGSDVTHIALNDRFPTGLFVAMTNGKVFHYYDWRDIQQRIDKACQSRQ